MANDRVVRGSIGRGLRGSYCGLRCNFASIGLLGGDAVGGPATEENRVRDLKSSGL